MKKFKFITSGVFALAMLFGAVGSVSADDADAKKNVLAEWSFADDDAGGWSLGWNSSEDTAVTDLEVAKGLGLKLTLNYQGSGWGDGNIKLAWTTQQVPAALNLRLLVPASSSKPKGPMQLGCAMNMPWTEAKSWTDLKLPERITIAGTEYLAQTVTCRLGTSPSAPIPRELCCALAVIMFAIRACSMYNKFAR